MKSNCCNAEMKIEGGDEGTMFYRCFECMKACDPAPNIKTPEEIAREIAKKALRLGEFKVKPTLEELEAILQRETKNDIEIMTDGSIQNGLLVHAEKVIAKAISAERNANLEKIKELEASLNKTVCVWCGHEGKKNALDLLNHVKECSKHPLGKSLELIEVLESKLAESEKENKRLIEFIELGSEFHE